MAKRPLPTRQRIFNLLKPYTPPPSGWDRVYEWLITRARIVMLIVEVAVIFTFVGKVVIDTQAKALDDDIKTQDFQLSRLSQSAEGVLRKLQNKASAYAILWDRASSYAEVMTEVNSFIGTTGSSLIIALSSDTLTISGEASFEMLAEIEQKIKSSPMFTNAVLTQLNANDDSETSAVSGDYILSAKLIKVNNRLQIR